MTDPEDPESRPDHPAPENSEVETDSAKHPSGDSGASLTLGNLVGHRLDDYQILRKLGRGGMADVYAAKQLNLSRNVALKVLRREFSRDLTYVDRFRREARAAAKMNHPNIVQIYDVRSIGDLHFIAQELIDGQNLRERIDETGPIDADLATNVLISVGRAMDVASEAGIIHRDIKPENIMLSSKGVLKVADFGLARLHADTGKSHAELTQAGLTMGTPRYMSPEQIQGKNVDPRSDLYSLGVTLYHLLAGRPPYEATDPIALAVMHLHETPVPLDKARGQRDLPDWLIATISRLMAKDPKDRFQSAAELVQAVLEQSADVSDLMVGTAAATTRLQRLTAERQRSVRRRRWKWATWTLAPVFAFFLGFWIVGRGGPIRVSSLLNPPIVKEYPTIEQQWLEAVRRGDAAGWLAVQKYFPSSDNATQQQYATKAGLQLARHYINAKEFSSARETLDDMLGEPKVRNLYRACALIFRHQVSEIEGSDSARYRKQINNAVTKLKQERPADFAILKSVFTPQELMSVGINLDADPPPPAQVTFL